MTQIKTWNFYAVNNSLDSLVMQIFSLIQTPTAQVSSHAVSGDSMFSLRVRESWLTMARYFSDISALAEIFRSVRLSAAIWLYMLPRICSGIAIWQKSEYV